MGVPVGRGLTPHDTCLHPERQTLKPISEFKSHCKPTNRFAAQLLTSWKACLVMAVCPKPCVASHLLDCPEGQPSWKGLTTRCPLQVQTCWTQLRVSYGEFAPVVVPSANSQVCTPGEGPAGGSAGDEPSRMSPLQTALPLGRYVTKEEALHIDRSALLYRHQ